MSAQPKAGAVLYAKNLAAVQSFYQKVTGLEVVLVEDAHVVLESSTFQLVILEIPEAIATSIIIDSPPKRRSETPIKLVFPVHSIIEARAASALFGGELNASEHEWKYQACRVCDGHDPEGNVFQLRQYEG